MDVNEWVVVYVVDVFCIQKLEHAAILPEWMRDLGAGRQWGVTQGGRQCHVVSTRSS